MAYHSNPYTNTRITLDEWQENCNATISYLEHITSNNNPQWIKALRSAMRCARDFNKQYYVLWNGTEYHIYDKHPTGNFDIVQPDGFVIH